MGIWHVNKGLMESFCIHATDALLFIIKSAVVLMSQDSLNQIVLHVFLWAIINMGQFVYYY